MSRATFPSVSLQVNDSVRREIEHFLQALTSYPGRFENDPRLSFQQHLDTIMSAERERRVNQVAS